MNLNTVAKDISKKEGGKVNLPIAQIKEVMKCFLEELTKYSDDEVLNKIDRYRGNIA